MDDVELGGDGAVGGGDGGVGADRGGAGEDPDAYEVP